MQKLIVFFCFLTIGIFFNSCKKEESFKLTKEDINGNWIDTAYAREKFMLDYPGETYSSASSNIEGMYAFYFGYPIFSSGVFELNLIMGTIKINGDSILVYENDYSKPYIRLKMNAAKTEMTGTMDSIYHSRISYTIPYPNLHLKKIQ